jgi:glutamyl-tRNA synthetase
MRDIVYKYALKNAIDYGGAEPKAVLGKVLRERPELKGEISTLLPLVEEVVKQVNSMSRDARLREIRKYDFAEKKKEEKGVLQELPSPAKPVLRFAPNPSGPLHLGHCRAAILNDEYAKKYTGKLILRIEDTDPSRVDPEAYAMIEEDLRWLGVDYHEVLVQSERLDLYYEHARELLKTGSAYVCTCEQGAFQTLRNSGKACGCSGKGVEENLGDFAKMFDSYGAGEAVVRLKTGVALPDPAMREFVIMRITDFPHPRAQDRRVYPLYNFAVVVDDHLMGVTHVLRGKDHLLNTRKQEFIYDYFSWPKPVFVHYGLMKIEGLELSTSLISKGIREGKFSAWDDPRLGTLRAMRRRGIKPEAIRKAIIDVGIKSTDISFSWKNLYAYNRELIERDAKRYFFVEEPKLLIISPSTPIKPEYTAPLHPDFPEKGMRKLAFEIGEETATAYISGPDFDAINPGDSIRLMAAFNVEIVEKGEDSAVARYISDELEEARRNKMPLKHWVSKDRVEVEVRTPEGVIRGCGERDLKKAAIDDIVQFERYGFVRIDNKNGKIVTYFAHK